MNKSHCPIEKKKKKLCLELAIPSWDSHTLGDSAQSAEVSRLSRGGVALLGLFRLR